MALPKLPPDSKPIIVKRNPTVVWFAISFAILVITFGILTIIEHWLIVGGF